MFKMLIKPISVYRIALVSFFLMSPAAFSQGVSGEKLDQKITPLLEVLFNLEPIEVERSWGLEEDLQVFKPYNLIYVFVRNVRDRQVLAEPTRPSGSASGGLFALGEKELIYLKNFADLQRFLAKINYSWAKRAKAEIFAKLINQYFDHNPGRILDGVKNILEERNNPSVLTAKINSKKIKTLKEIPMAPAWKETGDKVFLTYFELNDFACEKRAAGNIYKIIVTIDKASYHFHIERTLFLGNIFDEYQANCIQI